MNYFSVLRMGIGALSIKEKLIIFGSVLFALIMSHVAVGFIFYNKGKNLSSIEIAHYQTQISQLQSNVNRGQVVVNDRVVTKVVDRIKNVDHIVYVNKNIIKTVVVERPGSYSNGWIAAHNQSALGLPIDPALAADSAPSGVTDNAALDIITGNYGKYHQCLIVVDGWKEWYTNTVKLYQDNGKVQKESK
jgi:hypothetical protein